MMDGNEPEPIAVNERKAAAMLGVSPRKLFDLRKTGAIPFLMIGKQVRYSVAELKAYVAMKKEVETVTA